MLRCQFPEIGIWWSCSTYSPVTCSTTWYLETPTRLKNARLLLPKSRWFREKWVSWYARTVRLPVRSMTSKCSHTSVTEFVFLALDNIIRQLFNRLTRFYDADIFDYLRWKYLPAAYHLLTSCGDPERKERSKGIKLIQLNLKQLTGAFMILYIGLSTAFFVFIFELCIQKYQRRTRIIKVQTRNPTGTLKRCRQKLRAFIAKNSSRKVGSQRNSNEV